MTNVTAWETDEDMSVDSDMTLRAYVPTPVTDTQLAAQRELVRLINPEMAPIQVTVKDYLTVEDARNRANAKLFRAIIQAAFGSQDDVTIGHHLSFQPHGDIENLNEIPSADTLIFDHDLMRRVFGDNAIRVMQRLCMYPCDTRDAELQRLFNARAELPSFL